MRIIHIADLHISDDREKLEQIKNAMKNALAPHLSNADLVVIAGDIYDSAVLLNSSATKFFSGLVNIITKKLPLVVLRGTPTHDVIGSLDIFKHFKTDKELKVITEMERINLKYKNKNYVIYGIPGVSVTSFKKETENFYESIMRTLNEWSAEKNDNAYKMVIGHFCINNDFYINSDYDDYEVVIPAEIINQKISPDLCMLGHIHNPSVIEKKYFYAGGFIPYGFVDADVYQIKGKDIVTEKINDRGFYVHDTDTNEHVFVSTKDAVENAFIKIKANENSDNRLVKDIFAKYKDKNIHVSIQCSQSAVKDIEDLLDIARKEYRIKKKRIVPDSITVTRKLNENITVEKWEKVSEFDKFLLWAKNAGVKIDKDEEKSYREKIENVFNEYRKEGMDNAL